MHAHFLRKLAITALSSSLLVLPFSSIPAQAATLAKHAPVVKWSRGELAAALMASFHLSPSAIGPVFRDVTTKTPNTTAIETVTGDQLMQGVTPFTFAPNRFATQIDLLAALENELGLKDSVSLLQKRPVVRMNTSIPTSDWGVIDAALTLHLISASRTSVFDPYAPISSALFAREAAIAKKITATQVAAVADSAANSAWIGFPYWENASQNLNVGGSISQIAYQVENGELVLPGLATLTASQGTLSSSGAYLAPNTPGIATVTATVNGTAISQSLALSIYAPDQLSFASATPSVMKAGQAISITANVLSPNPSDLSSQVTDPADSGRTLTLTTTGPTGITSSLQAQDNAGQATFTFRPRIAGTYTLSLTAPGLSTSATTIQASLGPVATASLLLPTQQITYGQSVPVSVYLQPKTALPLPTYLPVSLSTRGSAQVQSVVSSVYTYAAEQPGGTAVGTISGDATGPATVVLSTPGLGFATATTSATGISSGTLVASVSQTALSAGSNVPVSAQLTQANGQPAPAGIPVDFTPVAPDGEEGLLATRSESNDVEAYTNSHGVASASLADQYMSGTYTLSVTASGYNTANTTYQISADPAVKLDAVIAPSPFLMDGHSAQVSVAAVDRFGNPVPGFSIPVHVAFAGHDGHMTVQATTVSGQGNVATVTAGALRGQNQVIVTSSAFPGQVVRLPMIVITNPVQLIQGKGTWATYNVYGAMGAAAMIQEMKAEGMTHLYLETAASGAGFYGQLPLDRIVDLAHQAGIAVITWSYAALDNLSSDEAAAKEALDFRTRLGSSTDGYTGDFEQNLNANSIVSYSAFIRHIIGPQGLYVATIYPPQTGYATPYAALAPYVTAFAPMDYWHGKEQDYTFAQVYSYITDSITEIHQAAPGIPIEVIAEAYDIWSNSGVGAYNPSAIEEEAAMLGAQQGGAVGISFYDLQTISPSQAVALTLPYPLPTVSK
ncbi:MAG: hypothetical protein OWT28_13620 [Firmicutes bacterium]|nr:hypothetical protein [Bacillota bacterium]